MKHIEIPCPGHEDAYLEGFLLSDEISYGQEKDRPAVIVCPGGGYVYLCPREGEPVALAYASAGFHAFVLHYSVAKKAANYAPLDEISWAIGLLRQNAQQWHIAPDKIAVCGFSAGGHVALSSGVIAEHKANAMILGYPVTCTPLASGSEFLLKLISGKDKPTAEDAASMDFPAMLTKEAPPLFVFATAEDILTGFCALPLCSAYSKLGIPYEAHIFQFGEHGYSLANAAAADGSSRKLDEAAAHWHGLSVTWLNRIFGIPEFTDKDVGKMMKYLKESGLI